MAHVKGFKQRLADGDTILAAEGYLFELERRGFLRATPFTPEVVVKHPEMVKALSQEFAHAGSDVTLAFTYNGNEQKLRLRANLDVTMESVNRSSLKIAREVATETNTLMAGNICNTLYYAKESNASDLLKEVDENEIRATFKRQVEWAVEEGADFIVAETYTFYAEAKLALEAILKYGNGLGVVINLAPYAATDKTGDGIPLFEACKKLEDQGASVVGINCGYGPDTMVPQIKKVREHCKGPISCLPVPYETTKECPCFMYLKLKDGSPAWFDDMDAVLCPQSRIRKFAQECTEIGVQYVGICCGNSSRYFRALAEGFDREVPASKYSNRDGW